MTYTEAWTKHGRIAIPEQRIDRPGLFDLVEPLRGHSLNMAAVIDARTGRCNGWTTTNPDLFPSAR